MKCPYCGSEHIEQGIAWGKGREVFSNVGLMHASAGIFGNTFGSVQVYSDLCLDCGAIVKSYIKGDTNRDWCKDAGSLRSDQ